MERIGRSGGPVSGGRSDDRLGPGEHRTERRASEEDTAEEVAEEAGECPRCGSVVAPEDVHVLRDNALWEFHHIAVCSECDADFERGYGWRVGEDSGGA